MNIHPRVQKTLDAMIEVSDRRYYLQGLSNKLHDNQEVISFSVLIALTKSAPGTFFNPDVLREDVHGRLSIFRALSDEVDVGTDENKVTIAIVKKVGVFTKEFLVATTPALTSFLESQLNENKDDYVSDFGTWMMPYFMYRRSSSAQSAPRIPSFSPRPEAPRLSFQQQIDIYRPETSFSERLESVQSGKPNRPLGTGPLGIG
jgi:hypothetical protein